MERTARNEYKPEIKITEKKRLDPGRGKEQKMLLRRNGAGES